MITDADVAAYDRDGVVCLRAAFDSGWIDRLRAAVERDLAAPRLYVTYSAESSSVESDRVRSDRPERAASH